MFLVPPTNALANAQNTPANSYTLHLADNSLIMGHRLSEWTGHGPTLEQDIAISNIALDLIGQARNFYQYAAHQVGHGSTEDSLAYLRQERDFKNLLITELPNGDWGKTICKLFFFSSYQYLLFADLSSGSDKQLGAIAEKSLKEVTYHRRWSSEWMIRLGDGTEESHKRMQVALNETWNYTGEMFIPAHYEEVLTPGISVDLSKIQPGWNENVERVLEQAMLSTDKTAWMHTGGKKGLHTEYLGPTLAEMQHLQRTYPGCEW